MKRPLWYRAYCTGFAHARLGAKSDIGALELSFGTLRIASVAAWALGVEDGTQTSGFLAGLQRVRVRLAGLGLLDEACS